MLIKAIQLTLVNFKTNRIRFFLSIVGILIGIILVVVTILLSNSFKIKMMGEMKVGSKNSINIAIGNKSSSLNYTIAPIFNKDDVKIVKSINHVKNAYGINVLNTQGEIKSEKSSNHESKILLQSSILGSDTGYIDSLGIKFSSGGVFKNSDEVVIGSDIAKKGHVKVGDSIVCNIDGKIKTYKIVGIIEKQPKLMFSDFGTYINNLIMTSNKGYQDIKYSMITTIVDNTSNILSVSNDIEKLLNSKSEIKSSLKDTGFQVIAISTKDVLDMIDRISGYINIFTLGVTILTTLIALIGVVNVMIITVYERTKEIGIMKAVGASNGQILFIYLIESGVIGLIGSFMGFFVGLILSKLLTQVMNWPFIFNPLVILLTIILGLGTTLIAGLIPARRAAGIDPNEALLFE